MDLYPPFIDKGVKQFIHPIIMATSGLKPREFISRTHSLNCQEVLEKW